MANHVKNTVCPKCRELGRDRKGDNLGVYDDGSAICWSCGYYIPSPDGGLSYRLGAQPTTEQEASSIFLPSDSDSYIPAVARLWLRKYDIHNADIIQHKLMWSEYWQQLLFPYFDKYRNLVGWQGRSFHPEARQKWYSQGDLKKLFHIIPAQDTYKQLVLVEDTISAIKVGRVAHAMPLFGNNIGNRLSGLSRLTNSLVIWLDPDMKTKTIKEAEKARQLGFSVRCLFSECDPKEHTNEQIEEYLK